MSDLFSYISEEPAEEKKPKAAEESVYSVHELSIRIKGILEPEFDDIWVEGEISNYKRHSSGHHYFSLKDERAVISCVMWRSTGDKLDFSPENGQKIRIKGSVSVYEAAGRYQIDVKRMILSGIGYLQAQFEALKRKLFEEGLFGQAHKKKLPVLVKNLGVVTAETGAAFQDIKKVIRSRSPFMNINLFNARVQGKGTETEIIDGIRYFNSHPELADVIIIGRGGGSLEDLWTFNEESVARAIWESALPVISAVGHEIDFSISDFVADVRAATPSHAAELVSLNMSDELHKIGQYESRINNLVVSYFNYQKEIIRGIENSHAFKMPADIIKNYTVGLDNLEDNFDAYFLQKMNKENMRLEGFEGILRSLNPESVLNRGYAIVRDKKTSKIIPDVRITSHGQQVEIKFRDGSADAEIKMN
ncbi:MAG: exodeoxyribonuclease VII large subunit [Candidatus Delongbacteria bacterium]|nr:exodeoxyribonuclease VII large subunit [Candidatus Delongbacteria bacterium]MDD4205682.1 exodeoxyribonuclease VII large subunit [Candidatus Delongbacteria bacterium]